MKENQSNRRPEFRRNRQLCSVSSTSAETGIITRAKNPSCVRVVMELSTSINLYHRDEILLLVDERVPEGRELCLRR